MPLQFATRLDNVETSAIRELFKLLGKPGIISFAGGFPDSAMFDVAGIKEAVDAALQQEPGGALQYGATEGYEPLREQLSVFMASKGVAVGADGLIVTTGSQQALDLLGKTMISPGDKVIVNGMRKIFFPGQPVKPHDVPMDQPNLPVPAPDAKQAQKAPG